MKNRIASVTCLSALVFLSSCSTGRIKQGWFGWHLVPDMTDYNVGVPAEDKSPDVSTEKTSDGKNKTSDALADKVKPVSEFPEVAYCKDLESVAKTQSAWYLGFGIAGATLVSGAAFVAAASGPLVPEKYEQSWIVGAGAVGLVGSVFAGLSLAAFPGANDAASELAAEGKLIAGAASGGYSDRLAALERCSQIKAKWIASRSGAAGEASDTIQDFERRFEDKETGKWLQDANLAIEESQKAKASDKSDAEKATAKQSAKSRITELQLRGKQLKRAAKSADNETAIESGLTDLKTALDDLVKTGS